MKPSQQIRMMIIGANGQLGTDLVDHFKTQYDLICLTENDIDVSDIQSVTRALDTHQPSIIINTAAFHKVDVCEKQPVRSFEVNSLGVKYLAQCSQKIHAKLVHISTDYVFDGKKQSPYIEDDHPHPLNIYGLTKLAGEYLLSNEMENYLILRVSGIYGRHRCIGKGGNFINSMMRQVRAGNEIRVVSDEILTPTSTVEICRQLDVMLKHHLKGLYHVTNEGHCSWYEFAQKIFDILGMHVVVKPVPVSFFPTSVRRPTYSVLENHKLKALKLNIMKNWDIALEAFVSSVDVEEL
ncbi:dTDP-4-dehydrorhamnose reductase [bacterium]|nr:dTDP-4-dehydrorhamnose reductase [bacterium]